MQVSCSSTSWIFSSGTVLSVLATWQQKSFWAEEMTTESLSNRSPKRLNIVKGAKVPMGQKKPGVHMAGGRWTYRPHIQVRPA